DIMARLDLITAKARYSLDYNLYAPEINTEGRLWLRQARHPLLEYLFRPKASGGSEPPDSSTQSGGSHPPLAPRNVVPIDVRLGFTFNLLIITGPNTGGKTVCLKTTGLLCLMAHAGLHLPAGEGSNV